MKITFAPGPSQLYPKVPEFLIDALNQHMMSLSHRSQAFSDIYAATDHSLRQLMNIPADYHIWFLGSATEAMERTIQNTVRNRSHHFVAGAFAEKFAQISAQLGRNVSVTDAGWGSGFDLDSETVPDDAELIAVTHNETSTGVTLDPAAISRLHARYPDKLLAVDIVSSVPHVQLDFGSTDMAIFSVQKGLGVPAGLGVLIAGPRALAKARELCAQGISIGSYHSFVELANHAKNFHTPETPNVTNIYLLGRVVQDLLDTGIGQIRRQIADQADMLYEALDAHPDLIPLVTDPKFRSRTVVVAEVRGGAKPFMDSLSDQGMSLGGGYGHQKHTHVRIANFPAHLGHTQRLLQLIARHAPVCP